MPSQVSFVLTKICFCESRSYLFFSLANRWAHVYYVLTGPRIALLTIQYCIHWQYSWTLSPFVRQYIRPCLFFYFFFFFHQHASQQKNNKKTRPFTSSAKVGKVFDRKLFPKHYSCTSFFVLNKICLCESP